MVAWCNGVLGSHKSKKMEYTSIRIDPALWKEFKIEALRQDLQVSDLMERIIRKELGRGKKPSD
jgi:hypothetical protein